MTAVTDRAGATDAEFQARIAAFEGAEDAPESDTPSLWEVLSDLIPCSEFAGCSDECECVEGELRLAIQRLIVAERVHAVDCEGDDCCVALEHRARLVNKAATLTPEILRARRTALRGQSSPTPALAAMPVRSDVTRTMHDVAGYCAHALPGTCPECTTDEDSNTADELAAAGLRACCGQPSERHCR